MPMIASPAQGIQQNKLNQLIATWPTLTLVQKASWNALAAAHDHVNEFGETKTLNGFQWFMSCNLNLLSVGEAIILSAPGWTVIAAPPVFTLHASAVHLWANFTPNFNSSGYWIQCFSTSPMRQSSLKLRKSTFLIRTVNENSTDNIYLEGFFASTFNLTWANFFNNSICTITVRLKLVQEGTGLCSPYTSGLIKIG
jgi:hypothetical protein